MKLEYIILAVIFIILLLAVLKINKKDVKLEFNKLTSYLGGKDNIIDTEVNLSRFIVTVKDIDKVDKEAIKNNLKYLQSQIKADTDNVTKVKIKKSSSSGIKTEEVTCKSNKKLVIQVAIPEDEGLKEIWKG